MALPNDHSNSGATRCFPSSIRSRSSGCAVSARSRTFAAGEALATAGKVGPGLMVISRRPGRRHAARSVSATTSRSSPMGPASSSASWRSWPAGRRWPTRWRSKPVEALVIPPDRLRALLVAEADLGERIMRALILRRVGLLETGGGGPIIVGRPEQRRRAAAEEFSSPQQPSAPSARSRTPMPRPRR